MQKNVLFYSLVKIIMLMANKLYTFQMNLRNKRNKLKLKRNNLHNILFFLLCTLLFYCLYRNIFCSMFRTVSSLSKFIYTSQKLSHVLFSIPKRSIIEIPEDAIQLSFVRSSGPGIKYDYTVNWIGGQNVNKVNTKVEARFNVYSADWMPE